MFDWLLYFLASVAAAEVAAASHRIVSVDGGFYWEAALATIYSSALRPQVSERCSSAAAARSDSS